MSDLEAAGRALEIEKCRRFAHYFIFDSGKLLTKDEHDLDNPIKPFPRELYLRVMLDFLLVSGRLVKPDEAKWALENGYERSFLEQLYKSGIILSDKSRQVMWTWLICAYLHWRAKYRKFQLILVQSKREEDAVSLVYNKEPGQARISFMEVNLSSYLQTLSFPKAAAFGHLYYSSTGSHIWAIPEGGDILRSNTASVVFSDEAAYQPNFGNSFTAAIPSIKGGGQYIGVSSAEPGEFQMLVEAP